MSTLQRNMSSLEFAFRFFDQVGARPRSPPPAPGGLPNCSHSCLAVTDSEHGASSSAGLAQFRLRTSRQGFGRSIHPSHQRRGGLRRSRTRRLRCSRSTSTAMVTAKLTTTSLCLPSGASFARPCCSYLRAAPICSRPHVPGAVQWPHAFVRPHTLTSECGPCLAGLETDVLSRMMKSSNLEPLGCKFEWLGLSGLGSFWQ